MRPHLFCSVPLASLNPLREPPSYPLHPTGTDLPNSTLKDLPLHNRQPADSNNTRLFEPRLLEIAVTFLNQLIEFLNLLVELRGNHADQPVVVRPRSFAYQQSWAKFALRQICTGKSIQNDLARFFHDDVNRSSRSPSVYSGSVSSSIPRIAEASENCVHS